MASYVPTKIKKAFASFRFRLPIIYITRARPTPMISLKRKDIACFLCPQKQDQKLGPKQRESPRDWESGVPLRHVAKRGDKGVGEINGED